MLGADVYYCCVTKASSRTTRIYDCSIWFLPPTGLAVPGVEKQYDNTPYTSLYSSPHVTRIVTGLTAANLTLMLLWYNSIE